MPCGFQPVGRRVAPDAGGPHPAVHMFGRLKRHSFCFLLLICAQGLAGMFDLRFAVRSLTSRTSTRRRGPRLRKTKNDFAGRA
jgi:hypothetical protein